MTCQASQAKTNRHYVTCQAKTYRHRTFEQQVESLTAYKAKYGDCHVKKTYKDDTVLASWVHSLRQGRTILNIE